MANKTNNSPYPRQNRLLKPHSSSGRVYFSTGLCKNGGLRVRPIPCSRNGILERLRVSNDFRKIAAGSFFFFLFEQPWSGWLKQKFLIAPFKLGIQNLIDSVHKAYRLLVHAE